MGEGGKVTSRASKKAANSHIIAIYQGKNKIKNYTIHITPHITINTFSESFSSGLTVFSLRDKDLLTKPPVDKDCPRDSPNIRPISVALCYPP